MKQKPFYQCEHCVYYTPYYNICDDKVAKVHCGYCDLKRKIVKPSLRQCVEFNLFTMEDMQSKNCELIQICEKDIFNKLHKIERQVKSLKLYLNKYDETLKIDKNLVD